MFTTFLRIFVFSRLFSCDKQEPRKWSTRPGNGTKNASAAVYARQPSEPSRSSPVNRRSTALGAMRRSTPQDASNVKR